MERKMHRKCSLLQGLPNRPFGGHLTDSPSQLQSSPSQTIGTKLVIRTRRRLPPARTLLGHEVQVEECASWGTRCLRCWIPALQVSWFPQPKPVQCRPPLARRPHRELPLSISRRRGHLRLLRHPRATLGEISDACWAHPFLEYL